MTPEAAHADRLQAVREAAGEWFRSGWINDAALRRIHEAYSDDRVRAGISFRILFFILTLCALQGAMGLLYMLTRSSLGIGVLALAAGVACAFVTDYMTGPLKRRQGGTEAAVSLFAVVQLTVAVVVVNHEAGLWSFETRVMLDLLWAAFLSLAAAWRWGYWPYGALASLLFFAGVSRLPFGRLMWLLIPLMLWRLLLGECDSPHLPPALRRCSAAILTVCILAFYAAVNVYSLDHRVVEFDLLFANPAPLPIVRWLSIALTCTVPGMVVWVGVRDRRRLFLNLGFLLGFASLVTLRQYVHLAPLWLVLVAGGLALIAAAALLKRLLDSAKDGTRGGFTAAPLHEDPRKQRALEVLASVATLTPESKPFSDKSGFQGKGGEFGGGGASGDF